MSYLNEERAAYYANTVKSYVADKIATKQDIMQYTTLPVASVDNEGKVFQYVGETTINRVLGSFYQCQETSTNVYEWVEVSLNITIDDELSTSSINPVQNAIITNRIEDIQDEITDTNNFDGAKNNLENTATTDTIDGVTFSVQNNGSVIVNGTATDDVTFTINNALELENYDYKLTGCPAGGNENSYSLVIDNGSMLYDIGEGVDIVGSTSDVCNVYISIKNGVTANGLVFRPMVRLASISDPTYVEFSKTNKQLTDEIKTKQDIMQVTTMPVASETYLDKVLIYTGATTSTYTKGQSYLCVYDNDSSTYSWVETSTKIVVDNKTIQENDNGELETVLKTFVGTQAQWDALTTDEQNYYDVVNITDDSNAIVNVVDKVENGNLNAITSNAVYDTEKDIYKANSVLGAKNLVKFPYHDGESKIVEGITWTVNSDGSVTANGTATARSQYFCNARNYEELTDLKVGVSYILSGCPSEGDSSTYTVGINYTKNGVATNIGVDKGNGFIFSLDQESENNTYGIILTVANGQTVSDLTFYPMLRFASDTDDTYQPYVKTNKELTENIDSVYKANGVLGAKNLIPYPYNGTSTTLNGITWTINTDGSVTANGTATDLSDFVLYTRNTSGFKLKAGDYLLSGISGGSSTTYSLYVRGSGSSSAFEVYDGDKLVTLSDDDDNMGLYLRVRSGATVSNLTFYPMLRFASDTDDTYHPYAMSNKELTDEIETLTANELGETVVINDYNTYGNPYTFPTDGYLEISSGENITGNIRVLIQSPTRQYLGYDYMNIVGRYQCQVTFVRKGMKAYIFGTNVSDPNWAVTFRGIV